MDHTTYFIASEDDHSNLSAIRERIRDSEWSPELDIHTLLWHHYIVCLPVFLIYRGINAVNAMINDNKMTYSCCICI